MRKLNLGCGPDWAKNYPEYEGLDINPYGQEHLGDVMVTLKELGKEIINSHAEGFDEIMANHFLEHFNQDELRIIFNWCHELLWIKGGILRIVVPHKAKDKAWVLSHRTFWTEATINWLSREDVKEYNFERWKIEKIVTNDRRDIHAVLRPV